MLYRSYFKHAQAPACLLVTHKGDEQGRKRAEAAGWVRIISAEARNHWPGSRFFAQAMNACPDGGQICRRARRGGKDQVVCLGPGQIAGEDAAP